ncbi:MAG: hypothetical protein NXI31_19880 [bacterium]|nr:hypothetical protein [bacterium]
MQRSMLGCVLVGCGLGLLGACHVPEASAVAEPPAAPAKPAVVWRWARGSSDLSIEQVVAAAESAMPQFGVELQSRDVAEKRARLEAVSWTGKAVAVEVEGVAPNMTAFKVGVADAVHGKWLAARLERKTREAMIKAATRSRDK